MLTAKFTILELIDLSLRVPEVGSVNFNILHAVLCRLVQELRLQDLKPECFVRDEGWAEAALARARALDPQIRRREKVVRTADEIKDMVKDAVDVADVPDWEVGRRNKKEEDERREISMEEDIEEEKQEEEPARRGTLETRGDLQKDEHGKDVLRDELNQNEEKQLEESLGPKSNDEDSEAEVVRAVMVDILSKTAPLDETAENEVSAVEDMSKTAPLGETTENEVRAVMEDIMSKTVSLDGTMENEVTAVMEGMSKTEPLGETTENEVTAVMEDMSKTEPLGETTENEVSAVMGDIMSKTVPLGETTDHEVTAVMENVMSKTAPLGETTDEEMTQELEEMSSRALRALKEEELFGANPEEVVQEMWRATNVHTRLAGVEKRLRDLFGILDALVDKMEDVQQATGETASEAQEKMQEMQETVETTHNLQADVERLDGLVDDLAESFRKDIARLQAISDAIKASIDEVKKNAEDTNNEVKKCQEEFDSVARKYDLEDLETRFANSLEEKANELRQQMLEIEAKIIPKEDFEEVIARIDMLEETKVNRDELGRLLEPGFVDNFMAVQKKLQEDVEVLKNEVVELEGGLASVHRRIDEDVLTAMQASFAEVKSSLEELKTKLDSIDIDDIHDTFARLEEEGEATQVEIEDIQSKLSRGQDDSKSTFKKILELTEFLEKLQADKADKLKVNELLKMKADVDTVSGKLDKAEFVAVMSDTKEDLKRLGIKVNINAEELDACYRDLRHELSLKMYAEDFVEGTRPIRNRIKAMAHEQRRIREVALTSLLPDSPGIATCFSCKRAANITGWKREDENQTYTIDENVSAREKSETAVLKLPPIEDLDNVKLPPPEKPRMQDLTMLPVLLAKATPQVGLPYERRKRDIDDELEDYFNLQSQSRRLGREQARTQYHQSTLPILKNLPAQSITLDNMRERYFKSNKKHKIDTTEEKYHF